MSCTFYTRLLLRNVTLLAIKTREFHTKLQAQYLLYYFSPYFEERGKKKSRHFEKVILIMYKSSCEQQHKASKMALYSIKNTLIIYFTKTTSKYTRNSQSKQLKKCHFCNSSSHEKRQFILNYFKIHLKIV